ncbi:alkaline phosphatase D family protein [Bacteroidota bacterium]
MNTNIMCVIGFFLILSLIGCGEKEPVKLGQETMGEFAPPDAFLEGEKHPYYGSENAWDQRFFYEHDKRFYKRRGQREILEILKGNFKVAEEYCKTLLSEDPDDLESLFNLAVVLAHQNKFDEAIKTVQLSVEKGLPFSRYLAGPRDLLKQLTESKEFRSYSTDFNIEILHGPMLGRVTGSSASFWVRTYKEVDIQIRASVNNLMVNAVLSEVKRTGSPDDYTVIVKLVGLKSDTKYYYEVLINGNQVKDIGIKSFSTFPAKGHSSKFSIAFGGGAGYVPTNERMWTTIRINKPLAFLFMGDNVYINMPENPNALHYYTYYRRQSRQEFRDLTASTACYAIWDDHDAATDDVWLGPYKDKPIWKLPLLENFKQNWINPSYGSKEWPSCWHQFSIGDVDFFMLDGRIYRTNPFAENPSMLGQAQKEWLKKVVRNSKAVFKVIASPVPWSFESKTDAKDTWNGFQQERQEIFDFLAENKVEGVILISADRHRSDAWEIKRNNGYSLYEFSSSRLTNQHFHPLIPKALFGYNEKQSFGMLTFKTGKSDPTVTYDIYSIDNEKIHSFSLDKSKLMH